ncbi:MAG TPA: cation transporter [Enterococcus aquimarinus]|uniref:cation transporter n=1 Tax=unclassified Ruoffia TaxID=2862149 RepID=UPI002B987A89|nr:cation transporter [Enterococcus aquimarinus]
MDCGSCAAKVERGVSKIDGVVNSNVDYIAETLSFEVADENESGVLSQVKQEKAAI